MLKVNEIDPGRMVHLIDEENRTILVLVAQPWENQWIARRPGPHTVEVARAEKKDELIDRLQKMHTAKML